MNEQLKAKLEKIKTHFTNNKKEYLIGMSCFVAGGTIAATLRRPIVQEQINMAIGNVEGAENAPIQNYIRTLYQKTITMYGNDVGRPGKLVLNTRTKKLYKAEYLAARDAGVSQSTMSNHLNGKTRSVMGDVYMFVEDAA